MSDSKEEMMKPEDELVEVLLDFIIVSANLAKQITRAVREKKNKEGEYKNVKNERTGYRDQRPADRGCRH